MFRGLAALSIDSKGRITIPAQYRDSIVQASNGQLVITIHTEDPCLLLYTLPQWQAIETELQKLPSFNPVSRRIQRVLIGHATDIEMDRQGRVLLPPLLRQYVGLDKSLMMVGLGKKFELWSEVEWQNNRDAWLVSKFEDKDDDGSNGGGLPQEILSLCF